MSTVLIVDHDPQTCRVLRIAFTARGYQVLAAAYGRGLTTAPIIVMSPRGTS